MIEAHVLDAWTLRSERSTAAFGYLNILGGFAAPMFLWLAGLSLVLAAERSRLRTGDRAVAGRALIRRGLEIFALAFIFRAQSFIVSPGNPLVSLLRVDILNIMGPSMMGAALLWWVAGGGRTAATLCGAAAATLSLVTPLVRSASWLPLLPPAVQWYISPAGNHSTFTLFPWAGFVFAGAACGAVLSLAERYQEARALRLLALAGAAIAAGSFHLSYRPSIYASSAFWTTSPTYFGLRVGLLMLGLAGFRALEPVAQRWEAGFSILARMGRHSLLIYWIHVELVYGYATALIHHRLSLPANAVAYMLLCALMYGSLHLRDHLVAWWQGHGGAGATPETLGA